MVLKLNLKNHRPSRKHSVEYEILSLYREAEDKVVMPKLKEEKEGDNAKAKLLTCVPLQPTTHS